MPSDIILNKVQVIERCLRRITEEYNNDPENLKNYTKQDSIVLNLQRACEAAIDLAMHVISEKGLGLPQTSRQAFEFLEEHGIIKSELARKLQAMVGFRNIAVHDYQEINLVILQQIIEKHLDDFKQFATVVMKL